MQLNKETKSFCCDVRLLSRQLPAFTFDVTSHRSHGAFVLSFFFTLIFSLFKGYNKNGGDITFLSFFVSSQVSLLLRLLTWQLVCFLFFSLSIWQVTNHTIRSFFLSFFLSFSLNFFLSFKITTKSAELSPSVLSFFLSFFLNTMCTDTQMYAENATHVFYIIRRWLTVLRLI